MPETTLVIRAEDRYSDAVRKMAQVTRSFSKDVDELEEQLHQLNAQKTSIKVDMKEAGRALKEAQKQFEATGKEADGLKLQLRQANYDNIKRNFALVTQAAREAERQLDRTGEAGRRAGSGVSSGISRAVQALAVSGTGDVLQELVLSFGSGAAGSVLGDDGGRLTGSILRATGSGAAAGTMIFGPGAGTVAGAAIGGVLGLFSSGMQVIEAQDNAFQSYYGGLYETAAQGTEDRLAAGMTTAGQREQDQIAFARRFGSEEAARAYLDQVRAMAVNTNYTYDEITGYSKSLLNSYSPEETLGVLQQLSDATAGLDLDAGGVSMFIAGLSRMRTTDKATQEYLNYFSERGLDVYEALSRSTGADKSRIAEMVTGGDISGTEAAQAILDYIQSEFGGLSERLASTYDAMVDNLGDAAAEIESAMGASYEEKAKEGLQADLDAYGGALGDALAEANRIIGEGRAIGENLDRQYSREALSALTMGTETTVYGEEQAAELKEMHSRYTALVGQYQNATEEDKAVIAGEIEALTEKAQAMAEGAYDASEMSQRLHDVNVDLIGAIRENTAALNGTPWMQSYETQQELSKGQGAAMVRQAIGGREDSGDYTDPDSVNYSPIAMGFSGLDPTERTVHSNAFGLERVPYDNYPALLHAGERVLTAREARNQDQGWAGILSGRDAAPEKAAATDWAGLLAPQETRGLTERTTDGQGMGETVIQVTVSNNSFGGNMTAEEVAEVIADRMMLKYQGGNRG